MITTFIWALRKNRNFLIEADKNGLPTLLKPLQFGDISKLLQQASITRNESFTSHLDNKKKESWTDIYREFQFSSKILSKERTYLWCINPKPRSSCALESDKLDSFKVVRVRLNRSYLCRWATNPQLHLLDTLREILGVDDQTNLFDIGGCILRMLLWPTKKLWKLLNDDLYSHFPRPVDSQVGFHFRCGDHNYQTNANQVITPPLHPELTGHMECVQKEGQQWNGTHAVDELSIESPIDAGRCGASILGHIASTKRNGTSLAYIASDSSDSASQVNDTLSWPTTFISPPGCHVDYDPTPQCAVQTILTWFALASSDYHVFQSYAEGGTRFASSSFARYAMIYSLRPENVFFPAACPQSRDTNPGTTLLGYYANESEVTRVSRLPQGNWVCTGGPIY
eukprot:gene25845-34433_t